MASSSKARKESSNSNANKRQDLANILVEKKRAISAKYRDRGASGKDQMVKELLAAEAAFIRATEKRENKSIEDGDNIYRYGKDAMKGKSFAGYKKGGYVACGASNPASQKRSKK
tara:strand:+ start:952 stop:1296 length:345 start_codon:yes stop_codon:yes gene_type:complete